jgi:serine phosphatase RsbU (regulator of sigma subunit)/sulfopyruvate decarboxylase TPP-binding subunit
MAVEAEQLSALDAFARASRALADGSSVGATLAAIVDALSEATAGSTVVLRVRDGADRLSARAVACASPAIAAELEGSRVAAYDPDTLPPHLGGVGAVHLEPIDAGGERIGMLELARAAPLFSPAERLAARVGAAYAAVALRDGRAANGDGGASRLLALAGEALQVATDEERAAAQVTRLAAEATRASGAVLWRPGETGELVALAEHGKPAATAAPASEALAAGEPVEVTTAGGATVVTVLLGERVLQLSFPGDSPLPRDLLAALGGFAVRAGHALRAGDRARQLTVELERTRALLGLAVEASEQLSLAHTLETAIEQVSALLGVERTCVYLHEPHGRLIAAAGRAIAGPHLPVAEGLLELGLGPFRVRGMVVVEDVFRESHLAGLTEQLAESGIEAAVALPLVLPDEVVGLLAVYPPAGRVPTANEEKLLGAIAAQLAIAVQNARLHEQATELGAELRQALSLEQASKRQLAALYEISRSFTQSLSLEATLDAVVRTVVELLDLDAAVILMPDARREALAVRALHIADEHLAPALPGLLGRSQPLERMTFAASRTGGPLVLDPELAAKLGPPNDLLVPFLEKGSTAVILPIATPAELHGALKLLSLDPTRPITPETLEIGVAVAAQAALAIENARLVQQQKEFADTMQRSLLPRSLPRLPGLELGDVYESSARVDVGGDVYDFLVLEDGRLAVVLGDVTGHGIDAAADMAMAKFVFRSLAREHPEPGEFLGAANDIVCGEIGPGKFITMLYLTIDPATGDLACASAGHPRPKLVQADGSVEPVPVHGLALGIEPGQEYDENRIELPSGGTLVLYTDGVVEARTNGELYGTERLEALLARRQDLPAGALARAVIADCRAFAGEELADDCAVVVIRRT